MYRQQRASLNTDSRVDDVRQQSRTSKPQKEGVSDTGKDWLKETCVWTEWKVVIWKERPRSNVVQWKGKLLGARRKAGSDRIRALLASVKGSKKTFGAFNVWSYRQRENDSFWIGRGLVEQSMQRQRSRRVLEDFESHNRESFMNIPGSCMLRKA